MKRFFVLLSAMFCAVAHATMVNLNWTVDGNSYANTTCETGGSLTLPAQAPTKYGYTFQGWYMNDTVIYGTGSQTGTPTPTNPVEPVWYQNGNLVLRALGNIKDSYSTATGKITRRVGVKVLDGTENWRDADYQLYYIRIPELENASRRVGICTHFVFSDIPSIQISQIYQYAYGGVQINGNAIFVVKGVAENIVAWKQWLADQHANGTPVTVYYPLAEPVEEYYDEQLN